MSSNPADLRRPAGATLVLLASLYCAQGLPSGLIAHALPVLLRQHGVDLAVIGLLKLLALPWLLKVLWAPWVDRLSSRRLGHHRGWILPLQGAVVAILLGLALLSPDALFGAHLPLLLGLLVLVNLAAATQDIATDGLTVRLLPERWRGLGNSLQVGGYKVGMIVSGSGLLALPGMGLWLAVVLTFKLGDALGSPMIKPMLVDQGWSNAELGQLTLVSSLVGIGGALLGGLLYARLGVLRALLIFGALQALSLAALALLVSRGGDASLVYALTLSEQAADGLSTVALFAAMMRQCRAGHEGADFTLQASTQILLGGFVGAASGVLAKALGYDGLFVCAGVLGLAALMLVGRYFLRHGWR